MFELPTTTKLKITDVVVLSQKNRQPDDNPGVKISIECAMPKAKRAAPVNTMGKPPAKYRDSQTGQTWSGRGLKPRWLSVALERGKKLVDFEIKGR